MSDQEIDKEPVAEAAPAPEQAGQAAEVGALQGEVAALTSERDAAKAEVVDLKDQLLRKAADFDNYRKRMMKEKDEARQFANSGLLGTSARFSTTSSGPSGPARPPRTTTPSTTASS